MSHHSRHMEECGAEVNMEFGVQAQKISENISKWSRDLSCYILAKDVATFCSHKKKKIGLERWLSG